MPRLFRIVILLVLLKSSHQWCHSKEGVTECRNIDLKKSLTIPNYQKTLIVRPPLREIPNDLFRNLPNLENLIINYTLVKKIYHRSFNGLVNLKRLNLYWNEINHIPENVFQGLNLSHLNLGGNDLIEIDGKVFAPLYYLKELLLSTNYLIEVPRVTMMSLKTLDLSGNRIEKIHENAFTDLKQLEYLNIRANRITSIERNAFKGLDKLKKLNIERNCLQTLFTDDFIKNLANIEEIRLTFNDFPCNELKRVVDEFMGNNITIPEGKAEPGPISYHGIFCLVPKDS